MLEILAQTGFPAGKLMLEITETLLMDDDKRIREVLTEFRQLGIRLAVDDFGTGYSALSYLREFPVNILKTDRSFIHDISNNQNSRRLVETIITMAHGLELVTIAEGVETEEQDAMLTELDCNMVQRYFYCKPVDAVKINDLTRKNPPNIRIVRSR